ncbi:MAG: FMN-binding protein [Eudoraea sp.]|nr:FMN-binding protein [Eudoraea sp.]NNJ40980.1 FMN-binding protein [Eudoraea sp.]
MITKAEIADCCMISAFSMNEKLLIMINRNTHFYLPLLFVLGLLLSVSCKDNPKAEQTKSVPEVAITQSLAPQYKDIAAFMGLSISDSTDMDKLLIFKALYPKDSLVSSDAAQNLTFYKGIVKNGKARALPIFESREKDLSLVLFTKRGYVGSIWAEVLFQQNPLNILAVRFGYEMESEGYIAPITEAAFVDQFTGREITFDGNSFALNQDNSILIEGKTTIDGISGATSTSTTVIEMMNNGFINLSGYLNQ